MLNQISAVLSPEALREARALLAGTSWSDGCATVSQQTATNEEIEQLPHDWPIRSGRVSVKHLAVRQEAEQRLRQAQMVVTPLRLEVVSFFYLQPNVEHCKRSVMRGVLGKGPPISLGTVLQVISDLTQRGILKRIEQGSAGGAYLLTAAKEGD